MTVYRLQRAGQVDVEFDGEELASITTQEGESERWSDVRIFRTASGRYVAEVIGRSVKRGEHDRIKVDVVDTPVELREALTRESPEGKRYLPNFILDALDDAANLDPAIAAITVERI